MIWTILQADLLWLALTLPLTVGVQLWLALRKRREMIRLQKQNPAWARGERTAEQSYKLETLRRRYRTRR